MIALLMIHGFAFHIAIASPPGATEEAWRATATFAPPSVRPATFRIRLGTPRHSALRPGAVIHGAFLATDSANVGMSWYALFDAFPLDGAGDLNPTPTDSLPFSATVRPSDGHLPEWTAEVQLQNGAHCILVLDEKLGRGELRSVSDRYNLQIVSAFMGLGLVHRR